MFRVKTVIVGLLLILFLDKAYAVTLTATVDKTEATLQDQIMLTLSVEGTQSTESPKLPSTQAFDFISRGSSTRMQIINGQVSSSVDYNYLLLPKKTGTFEIGPATITHQGKTISSRAITLKIGSANSQPQSEKDLFITTSVSTKTPYVNEQIIYTFRLFRRVKIANASLENPSFEGFRVEPLGEEQQYETREEKIEKEPWLINDQIYTYEEAKQKCKAYGSDLANYQQIVKAYNDGMHAPYYGWSEGTNAYQVIDPCMYQKLVREGGDPAPPGVQGGKFPEYVRFGTWCYGVRPEGQVVDPKSNKCPVPTVCQRNPDACLPLKSDNVSPFFPKKRWSMWGDDQQQS